jgi:hypothetical protein
VDAEPAPEDLAPYQLTEAMAAELRLGVSKIPDRPLPEDLQAYLFALMATKVIAGCVTNFDRCAALRLLYSAADELRWHKFPEDDRCLIEANAGDIEPWVVEVDPPEQVCSENGQD